MASLAVLAGKPPALLQEQLTQASLREEQLRTFRRRMRAVKRDLSGPELQKERSEIVRSITKYLNRSMKDFGPSFSIKFFERDLSIPLLKHKGWKRRDVEFLLRATDCWRNHFGSVNESFGVPGYSGRRRTTKTHMIDRSMVDSLRIRQKKRMSMLVGSRRTSEDSYSVAHKAFDKLLQGSGKTDELNLDQWYIGLNACKIEMGPDESDAIYYFIVVSIESEFEMKLELVSKPERIESEMSEEEVKEELAAFKARRKKCRKTQISQKNFTSAVKWCDKLVRNNPSLSITPLTSEIVMNIHNSIQQSAVLFRELIRHLAHDTAVNMNEKYLTRQFTEELLRKDKFILETMRNAKAPFSEVVQVMEYVCAHLDDESSDGGYPLLTGDLCAEFLVTWSERLRDERSQVSKAALVLLSEVLCLIISRRQSAEIVFESRVMRGIYENLFAAVRSKRAVELAEIAKESAIAVTEILASVCDDGSAEDDLDGTPCSISSAPEPFSLSMPVMVPDSSSAEEEISTSLSMTIPVGKLGSSSDGALPAFVTTPKSLDHSKSMPSTFDLAMAEEVTSVRLAASSLRKRRSMSSMDMRSLVTDFVPAGLNQLISLLRDHSDYSNEKHESVRGSCVTLLTYIIFGTPDDSDLFNPVSKGSGSADLMELPKTPRLTLSSEPKRIFLLDSIETSVTIAEIIENCMSDRAQVVRDNTLKLMQKLEKAIGLDKLTDFCSGETMRTYEKRKKRSKPKKKKKGKSKRESSIARMRRSMTVAGGPVGT